MNNFAIFWKTHSETVLTMLQPINMPGITQEQYLKSQAKKLCEMIYLAGVQDGATESLRDATELLKILNKEMNGAELSTEERLFKATIDNSVPSFIQSKTNSF